jgi:hypothetical protein
MVKNSHGRTTSGQMARCAELSGGLGISLKNVVGVDECTPNASTNYDYDTQCRKFLKEFDDEGLFDYKPGR